ncbi:MAG: hypothetical protein PHX43_02290 [Alphaproteobacteria bacterium]|nr:hypothetical protein [Alphaproteobacteria bacterium]
MPEIVDDRFERVYAEAIKECRSYSTEDLLSFVKEKKKFPYDKDEDYLDAYDLTLMSFALERRSDKEQYLTPETKEQLEVITSKARESVASSLEFHERWGYTERGSSEKKYDFLMSSISISYTYNHMILSHVYPEYYGPEAAPADYKKAVDIMAEYWGWMLSGKQENVLFSRWKNGSSDSESFEIEHSQAALASRWKENYTEKQISDFKEGLKRHLLLTGLSNVSMKYHPDTSLCVAGYESGIDVGMLTFPFDTSTSYWNRPHSPYDKPYVDYFVVKIYNGRRGDPHSIPVKVDGEKVSPVKPSGVTSVNEQLKLT